MSVVAKVYIATIYELLAMNIAHTEAHSRLLASVHLGPVLPHAGTFLRDATLLRTHGLFCLDLRTSFKRIRTRDVPRDSAYAPVVLSLSILRSLSPKNRLMYISLRVPIKSLWSVWRFD